MVSSKQLELKRSVEITKNDLKSLVELLTLDDKEEKFDSSIIKVVRSRQIPDGQLLHLGGNNFAVHPNQYHRFLENSGEFIALAKKGDYATSSSPVPRRPTHAEIIRRKVRALGRKKDDSD